MARKRTLGDVFSKIGTFPWHYVVYLSPRLPTLALDSECVVLDPDDVDVGHDVPEAAVQLGFLDGLGIDDIRSIRENARLQGKEPSKDEMLEALRYYLENDAFIEFE